MPKYTPVSATRFASQRWQRHSHYRFAADATLVPVLLAELPKLLPSYVLTFGNSPDGLGLMVMTGLLPQQNAYLSPQHRWQVPYVPAVLRSHPFKLGTLKDGQSRGLFVDEDSGLLHASEGEPFFDEAGQPAPGLKTVMDFLTTMDVQHAVTLRAVDALNNAQVLEPWPVRFELPDTTPGAAANAKAKKQLAGLWRVNEAALNALAPDALAQLRQQGALAMAYAQLFSMAQMENLVALVQRLAQPPQPGKPSVNGLPTAPAFQLPASDTLKFS